MNTILFDEIANSYINGQKAQAFKQFDSLLKHERFDCLQYFDTVGFSWLNERFIKHTLTNS